MVPNPPLTRNCIWENFAGNDSSITTTGINWEGWQENRHQRWHAHKSGNFGICASIGSSRKNGGLGFLKPIFLSFRG